MVSINGLSSAFPKNKVSQDDIKNLGRKLFSSKINFKKMEKVYDNSGVKTRYLSEQLSWYLNEHNWSERNFLFKKNALSLLKKSTALRGNPWQSYRSLGWALYTNEVYEEADRLSKEEYEVDNQSKHVVSF